MSSGDNKLMKLSSKTDFLEALSDTPGDYSKIVLSAAEQQRVSRSLAHLSTGATAALPVTCVGKSCPFNRSCPYLRIDEERKRALSIIDGTIDPRMGMEEFQSVVPVGKPCLVEINLLNEWTSLYIQEYEVDPTHFTDFSMIRELAEIELMLWRLNNNLAKPGNAELVQETIVGVSKQGDPLTRLEVSAIWEVKERLQNRKSKLVKLLVGDRQEKYKREAALKQRQSDDPSSTAARLRGQIDRLLSQAKSLDMKLAGNDDIIDVTPIRSGLTPEDLISGKK